MRTTSRGIKLIKEFEGLSLKAYKCPAGMLTIGYGHTGADVKAGTVWTKEKAEAMLEWDIEAFEKGVTKLVTSSISDFAFSALVSFAYNVGLGNLKKSTLLKYVNEGKTKEAAAEFLKWNKAGGKVLAGLTKRRQLERDLFLSA